MGTTCTTDQSHATGQKALSNTLDETQKWQTNVQHFSVKLQEIEAEYQALMQSAVSKEQLQKVSTDTQTHLAQLRDLELRFQDTKLQAQETRCSSIQKESVDSKTQLQQVQLNLDLTEQKYSEAQNQAQEVSLRLHTQEQISATLEGANFGLKTEINDQHSQLPTLHDELTSQKLFAVTQTEVRCLDPATGKCQQLFPLRQEIQVNSNSSSTFITSTSIFVCGGGYPSGCIFHIGKSAYILEGDGVVLQQPDMLTGRYTCGVIWDQVAEALYVFGGGSTSGTF